MRSYNSATSLKTIRPASLRSFSIPCDYHPSMLPLLLAVTQGAQVQVPKPDESDFVVPQVQLADGERLSGVRLHVSTFGQPRKDAKGQVTNAVLIMHGTGGNGHSLINPIFAGVLFGPGQPLDSSKYYIILPDALGHGQSSKPSNGLHAKFPHYGYRDIVQLQYRLLTEHLGVNHLRLVMG